MALSYGSLRVLEFVLCSLVDTYGKGALESDFVALDTLDSLRRNHSFAVD